MKQHSNQRCKTKYPLLLVHGVGIRGEAYWGRTPAALRRQGATVLCSRQDAMGSLQSNVRQLHRQARGYLRVTRAEKLNLLAHSKGGLEAKILACTPWGKRHIASVTTISSPHLGIHALDTLACIPAEILLPLCTAIDTVYSWLGDDAPNTKAVIDQLGTVYAARLDSRLDMPASLVCQSYTSFMCRGTDDFLLTLTHWLLRITDGVNDGLVPLCSAKWAKHMGTLQGFSHIDTMDFWHLRKNTQLVTWYLSIVANLKIRSL